MEIIKKEITVSQLNNEKARKILEGAEVTPYRINTFLSNPNLVDEQSVVLYAVCDGEKVVGRTSLYPTKMLCDGHTKVACSGRDLFVDEEYRKEAIGMDLMMYPLTSKSINLIVFSGISNMALPLYKALKYHILEFPRMMQLRNFRCLLQSKGMKGMPLRFFTMVLNIPLWIVSLGWRISSKRVSQKFEIEQVQKVPEWINDVVTIQGDKYMELHDQKWFQWNLDYNFNYHPRNRQFFYIVKKHGKNLGFFMTKERYRKDAGGLLSNVVIGSIVEWGSYDESLLSESDIYKLALRTFAADVDIVETATDNNRTVKSLKRMLFIHHDFAHIVFKDKTKQYKDSSDISKWRIRYGYADVILT